ncbi:MAG: SDR family oxidoreductase [SAR202 cluster bacterium]|nr:SDR family oxidoreductase [SAR202 cluster bacterium]
MSGKLDGKVALVTGAGSGIGRATALSMAREGARVVASDISGQGGRETVDLIVRAGGRAIFVKADASNEDDVRRLVSETVTTYGRLDCAFNNAGMGGAGKRTHEHTEDDWDRTIALNVTGVWLCMKYEIQQMLRQGGGVIVNTSSIRGLVGLDSGLSAYVASKHAVLGLTKSAALEYAKDNIRINAVCPGVVETPMVTRALVAIPGYADRVRSLQPVGRLGRPEEIAETVTWLCSDAAAYVNGHATIPDGGWTAQ